MLVFIVIIAKFLNLIQRINIDVLCFAIIADLIEKYYPGYFFSIFPPLDPPIDWFMLKITKKGININSCNVLIAVHCDPRHSWLFAESSWKKWDKRIRRKIIFEDYIQDSFHMKWKEIKKAETRTKNAFISSNSPDEKILRNLLKCAW